MKNAKELGMPQGVIKLGALGGGERVRVNLGPNTFERFKNSNFTLGENALINCGP